MLTISRVQEPYHYKMSTFDFVSCQNVGAAQDQILNKVSGKNSKDGIDNVMRELYGAPTKSNPEWGSMGQDMHSKTCQDAFCDPTNKCVFDIENEDGTIITVCEGQNVLVNRNGKDIVILSDDLIETDSNIRYSK
jgi:hypothetical protein